MPEGGRPRSGVGSGQGVGARALVGACSQAVTTFLYPPPPPPRPPLPPTPELPALATHWTLDFDLSLPTRPGQLMVLAKYLKVAAPPPLPHIPLLSPHTTTTLAPLPHDRLDPPSCQPGSILHHWPMDCVSKERGVRQLGNKMGPD